MLRMLSERALRAKHTHVPIYILWSGGNANGLARARAPPSEPDLETFILIREGNARSNTLQHTVAAKTSSSMVSSEPSELRVFCVRFSLINRTLCRETRARTIEHTLAIRSIGC